MRTIALAARKGGAGKSTIAAHLSVLADTPEAPALLVDTDPQGSLFFWFGLRSAETPLCVKCEAREIRGVLNAAREDGIQWVILDGPPHNSSAIAEMIRHADLTLIPTRPAAFDLAAVEATIELCKAIGRPYMAVLNAVPPKRGPLESGVTPEARQALASLGAPVWEGVLTNRAAFAHALAGGQAVTEFDASGLASYEISKLWSYVQKLVGEGNEQED